MKCLVPIQSINLSIDPEDILVLEEAVYQREVGKVDGIVAIAINTTHSGQAILQEALIRGATEAILIETEENFDELDKAKILAKVAEQENLSLIKTETFLHEPRYLSVAAIMQPSQQLIKEIPLSSLKLDLQPSVKGLNKAKTQKARLGIRVNSVEALVEAIKEDFLQAANNDQRLATAKIVLGGGRGFKSREELQQLQKLAARLEVGFGVTGALVRAGYLSHDYQLGQTAKGIKPEIYFAIGISGAMQHVVGIDQSKIIVAINRNPDAPIFQIADYGLVATIHDALPALEKALSLLLDKP